ncbi:hypothetical protein HY624_00345 [Candidatus Uhrbacteria bacterium]|nr:hypothetical protein [Candidatus Uhrbacteria bacterium]
MDEQLSKQEQRRLEYVAAERTRSRKQFVRRFMKWALIIVLAVGVVGYFIWFVANQPVPAEADIISRNGMHWHPHLRIAIKGKEEVIPPGIGLGAVHDPMHTHDPDGIIHLEYGQGMRVTKDDTRLGRFFEIWGKQFTKECIFDSCTGGEGTMKMMVNGKENTEFEHYAMQDNDKIEIIYE